MDSGEKATAAAADQTAGKALVRSWVAIVISLVSLLVSGYFAYSAQRPWLLLDGVEPLEAGAGVPKQLGFAFSNGGTGPAKACTVRLQVWSEANEIGKRIGEPKTRPGLSLEAPFDVGIFAGHQKRRVAVSLDQESIGLLGQSWSHVLSGDRTFFVYVLVTYGDQFPLTSRHSSANCTYWIPSSGQWALCHTAENSTAE